MLFKKPITVVVTVLVLTTLACNFLATPAPTPTLPPTATPVPSQTPMATFTPIPTDTPTATPAPTRTPRPTATATPIPQPGDVLLSDQFESNKNNWFEVSNAQIKIKVEASKLSIQIKDRNILYYSSPAKKFKDVDLTVEATLVDGSNRNSMYGVQCRKTDNDNYYMAAVAANGLYTVTKLVGGNWKPIADWTASSAVKTGKATNTLQFICAGEALQFWVNGVRLVTVKDSNYTVNFT